jgi:chromosome segregation ATPase
MAEMDRKLADAKSLIIDSNQHCSHTTTTYGDYVTSDDISFSPSDVTAIKPDPTVTDDIAVEASILQRQLHEYQLQIDALEASLERSSKEICQKDLKIESLQHQLEVTKSLTGELETASNQQCDELKLTIQSQREEIQRLQQELVVASDNNDVKLEMESRQIEIIQLKSQIDDKVIHIERLESELELKSQAIEQVTASLASQADDSRRELDMKIQAIDDLKLELEAHLNHIEQLTLESEAKDATIDELRQELANSVNLLDEIR